MKHIFEYLINRKLTAKDANKNRIRVQTNEIRYEAAEKLDEIGETTMLLASGLHADSFNCDIIEHTFKNGKGLIKFKNDVTLIGISAFYNCDKLTSIIIPNSVTSIQDKAFYKCINLKEIIIPNSVTNIGWNIFGGCSKLASVTIPNSLTSIGDVMFCDCNALRNITIPDSITNIGTRAFNGCTNLESINIPNSVTHIGTRSFEGCANLKEIIYDGTLKEWVKIRKVHNWKYEVNPDCIVKCIGDKFKIEKA